MNGTNITLGGEEAATGKPEAQQWISVSVTYLQTAPDGRKKKESLEMLVDEKHFGLAEKTAKVLLQGREKLSVTGCRRKLIAALLEADGTDGSGQAWPTYEAQTAYQTASGAEFRRNWIVLAPSFHAAIDTVDWNRHPTREKLIRIDERHDLVVVTGRTYQQTNPTNEEL